MILDTIKNSAFTMYSEMPGGYAYKGVQGLTVIQTIDIQADGEEWIHTSFSRRGRMPDYTDMEMIKRVFVGRANKAIMVFPDEAHHVNIHNFCLHFFTPVGHDPLPEFSHGGMI